MISYRMLRGPFRTSVVVSVVLGAMLLLLPSAGDSRSRARAADACSFSYVEATVYNDTDFRMEPYFFDKGFTNAVCEGPSGVGPRMSGRWKVGDVLFGTSAKIRYRLTNGDEVELTVFVYPGERNPSLACGWTIVVSSPRAFDCKANWVSGAVTGKAQIRLAVFPIGHEVRHGAEQARSAVAGRCFHGSALVGTTTNQTGVPLELVGASHGPADAWCRAPGQSQAAHTAGRWKLGGPRSGASARFVYRLPNGDEVDFAAAASPRGGAVGCAPLDRARTRLFGCRAIRNGSPNGESPSIDLEVFRVRAP
jgi:hypothetical protein